MTRNEIADGLRLGDAIGEACSPLTMIPPAKSSLAIAEDAVNLAVSEGEESGRLLLSLHATADYFARCWNAGRPDEIVEALRIMDPLRAASVAACTASQLGERGNELAAYLGAVWTVMR